MTLPALLSKMSPRIPRFVTINGLIVSGTDGVMATPNGYHQSDHGRVTPVRKHTNHGGRLPSEADVEPWWRENPELLEIEMRAMDVAFPGFTLTEFSGRPAWVGELNSGRGRFQIMVLHRPDHGLPRVVPASPSLFRRKEGRRFRWSPHLYLNGDLCVAGQSDWDPSRDDATTVVGWAAHWLATFTEWRITGRWPCEGAECDAA